MLSNARNIYATTVTIGQNATAGKASQVKTGKINGAVNFAADAALQALGIKRKVTTADGNGVLATTRNITGSVGANGGSLDTFGVGVNNGNVVTLGGDIYAKNVAFADGNLGNNPVGIIQVAGNLIATNIKFGQNTTTKTSGGTLEFNGKAQQQLSGQILQGGTLF